MSLTSKRREPLVELALVDFVPEPNGAVRPQTCPLPSPFSGPIKRRHPTPSMSKDCATSPSTPKRRVQSVSSDHIAEISLCQDELGTGKSPARRLFVNEPSTPRSPRTSSRLAPSPPLGHSTAVPDLTRFNGRRHVHDCGFTIFVDAAGKRGTGSTQRDSPPVDPTLQGEDQENIPPRVLPSQAGLISHPSTTKGNHAQPRQL